MSNKEQFIEPGKPNQLFSIVRLKEKGKLKTGGPVRIEHGNEMLELTGDEETVEGLSEAISADAIRSGYFKAGKTVTLKPKPEPEAPKAEEESS